MTRGIRLSKLANFDEAQLEEELKKLTTSAKTGNPDQAISELSDHLLEFEREFGFTSDQLPAKLARGDVQETWEVCQWLMLIKRLARLKKAVAGA